MLAFTLPVLLAFTQIPALTCATPINLPPETSALSLTPRGNSPVCQNGGKAGTPQPKRTLSNQIWCAPASSTYLSIDLLSLAPHPGTTRLLLSSALYAIRLILKHGPPGFVVPPFSPGFDHVISNLPAFSMSAGAGVVKTNLQVPFAFVLLQAPPGQQRLVVSDAAGHHVTWGVLGAAVGALAGFMQENGYGMARFRIFDGENQVGTGELVP